MTGVPTIRVHDTLTGDLVDLEPREPGRISMYACGPTVYNFPHLGNVRTAMSYDTIRRYLEWRGFDVTFAMNITDTASTILI
jgi:cysteinyl-tRNA synthetase